MNKGDTGAVLGVGRLGTLVCAVASTFGAKVVAVSRSRLKLERAKKFGASEVINASFKDSIARMKDITNGIGADIVVDTTGNPEGLNLALELTRPRGTLALKTTCGLNTGGINTKKAVVDEIRIQGSRCGSFGKAIKILKKGAIPVRSLISHVYPIERLREAIIATNTASKVLIEL